MRDGNRSRAATGCILFVLLLPIMLIAELGGWIAGKVSRLFK